MAEENFFPISFERGGQVREYMAYDDKPNKRVYGFKVSREKNSRQETFTYVGSYTYKKTATEVEKPIFDTRAEPLVDFVDDADTKFVFPKSKKTPPQKNDGGGAAAAGGGGEPAPAAPAQLPVAQVIAPPQGNVMTKIQLRDQLLAYAKVYFNKVAQENADNFNRLALKNAEEYNKFVEEVNRAFQVNIIPAPAVV